MTTQHPNTRSNRRDRYDALDSLPFSETAPKQRSRARRLFHSPLPLLPMIALVCGGAVGYVAQTAQMTQASYQVATLQAQQTALRAQDQQLADQLARLSSAERVVTAARQMGMIPPTKWNYVSAAPTPLTTATPQTPVVSNVNNTKATSSQLVADLSGAFSPSR